MKEYEIIRLPQRIFGSKTTGRLAGYLHAGDIKKCLIVSGSRMIHHPITQRTIQQIKEFGIECDQYAKVEAEPSDTTCLHLGKLIREGKYDCVVGIGGGSPMDAAKAGALIAGIPEEIDDLHEYGKSGTRMKESWHRPCMLVLMPTTSGTGAETTATSVITSTQHQLKFSFGNRSASADLCIIDPDFTLGMPATATVYGAADALAHTVESLVGTAANDYTNAILLECLERIWKWLPIALKEPYHEEARQQLAWAAHNALSNGGIPNGHAVGHAIGSLYHLTHGHACMIVLPTVIRHFAESSQPVISSIAARLHLPVTGDAHTDANYVADAILAWYKALGLKPLRQAMLEKGYEDDKQTFIQKMTPVILDDFKSKQWLPPIHTGDYQSKVAKVCTMIYNEQ